MTVIAARVQLRLDGSFSLKDKRRVLRPLLDRLRQRWGVSAAEVDDHDLWNVAQIGLAFVGPEESLQPLFESLENGEVAVEGIEIERVTM